MSAGGTIQTITVYGSSERGGDHSFTTNGFLVPGISSNGQLVVTIHIDGGPATVDQHSSAPWAVVDASMATVPGDIHLTLNSAGLSPGDHSAFVSIQCDPQGSPCVPFTLPVSIHVLPFSVDTNAIAFSAKAGGLPSKQQVNLTNASTTPLTMQITTDQTWLSAFVANPVGAGATVSRDHYG